MTKSNRMRATDKARASNANMSPAKRPAQAVETTKTSVDSAFSALLKERRAKQRATSSRNVLTAHIKERQKRLREGDTTISKRAKTVIESSFKVTTPPAATERVKPKQDKRAKDRALKRAVRQENSKSWHVNNVWRKVFAVEFDNIDFQEDGKTPKVQFLSAKTGDLQSYVDTAWAELKLDISKRVPFKANVKAQLVWFNENQKVVTQILHPKSYESITAERCMTEGELQAWWDAATLHLLQDIESHEGRGSGWRLVRVNYLEVKFYDAHLVSAGLSLPTPDFLAKHQAVVNIKDTGVQCGRYAMLASHYHRAVYDVIHHADRRSQHPEVFSVLQQHHRLGKDSVSQAATYDLLAKELGDPFVWTGVRFPMDALSDWSRFERNNPGYIIDCYWYQENGDATREIIPLYVQHVTRKERQGKQVVRILMYGERNSNPGDDKCHYVWWKNVSGCINAIKGTRRNNMVDICPYCIHWVNASSYDNHMKAHVDHGCPCKVTLPPPDGPEKEVSFGSRPFCQGLKHKEQLPSPLVGYLDFEANNVPCEDSDSDTAQSGTHRLCKHLPNSCAIVVTKRSSTVHGEVMPEYSKLFEPDGTTNCVEELGKWCHHVAEDFYGKWKESLKPINESTVPESYSTDKICHICCNRQHTGFEELTERERRLLCKYLEICKEPDLVSRVESGDTDLEFIPESRKLWFKKKFQGAAVMFEKLKWRKVRDHNHETGCYRGAAHSHCNVQFTNKKFKFVLYFHNFKGYDQHLLLKHIKRHDANDHISALCMNTEKFHSVTWSRGGVKAPALQFQDSMGILQSSLDKVVSELSKSTGGPMQNLPRTRELVRRLLVDRFGACSQEQLEQCLKLVSGKQAYPYEWNDPDRWSCTELFSEDLKQSQMYYQLKQNRLHSVHNPEDVRLESLQTKKDEEILEDTMHAKEVWDAFGLRTFKDYHNLYLQLDVHHLSDAMEHARSAALNDPIIGLDPAWHLGVPGLTFSAALKYVEKHHPDIKLETITDIDMFTMIMASKRGGICQVNKRHVVANNKYMKDFDPEKCSIFSKYFDMTSLYGAAMCEPLPTGNYQWVDPDTVGHETKQVQDFLDRHDDDGPTGFFVQVKKLYLPPELHDKFADYPLAPETKAAPEFNELSPFTQSICPPKGNTVINKLILDLKPKYDYVCHGRNLKFMLKQGYQLEGITRVISFDQSAWLKDYIEALTKMRQEAAAAGNERLVTLIKLYINSLYGKLCENILGRPDIKVAFNNRTFEKLVKLPQFKTCAPINDDLMCVLLGRTEAKVGTLVAAGMSVLELSKLHMQRFHYEVMMEKFGAESNPRPSIKLCYTDTDSLVYEMTYDDAGKHVKGDAYSDMFAIKEYFDMSGFKDKMPQFYDGTNHKVAGKMKLENGWDIILVWVALLPKSYAFMLQTGDPKKGRYDKKAKGVNKSVISSEMFLEDYLKVLYAGVDLFRSGGNLRQLLLEDKELQKEHDRKPEVKEYKRKQRLLRKQEKDASGLPKPAQPSLPGQSAMDAMQHKRNLLNIQSKGHNLGLDVQRNRVVLSGCDNKRWWLDDGISSLPFGHWRTKVPSD